MPDTTTGVNFDPSKDIPDLSGKVIFITGGTSGIGACTLQTLASKNPSHIYFTGRNSVSATTLLTSLRTSYPSTQLTFIKTDMTSLSSVRTSIQQNFTSPRLDILLCNAGIMAQPPILSIDGFEIQFAVNHLAHAMTIQTLLPTLLATASQPDSDVRVITLSSQGYRFHPRPGILFTELSSHSPISRWFLGPRIRYGQSKLANILYAAELARRYPQLTSVSVHPGVVMTDLITNASFANRWMIYVGCWVAGIPILSPSEGSFNSSWAAAGASKDELRSSGSGSGKGSSGGNGGFYMPVGKAATESLDECARDEALAGRLWEWTEGVLGKI